MIKLTLPLLIALSSVCNANIVYYPSDHDMQIFGRTWTEEVKHNHHIPQEECSTKNSASLSQCKVTLKTGANLPADATHVNLRLKAKAWTKNIGKPHNSHCLIYASIFKSQTERTDHVIHVEEWSPEFNIKDRRRISYSTIKVPVQDGQVSLSVGKKVKGHCSIDFAVYLESYET